MRLHRALLVWIEAVRKAKASWISPTGHWNSVQMTVSSSDGCLLRQYALGDGISRSLMPVRRWPLYLMGECLEV